MGKNKGRDKTSSKKKTRIFSANDLANYVVCPQSWKLKLTSEDSYSPPTKDTSAAKERKDWIETQSMLAEFKLYAKVAYVLLVLLVIVVFLMELKK